MAGAGLAVTGLPFALGACGGDERGSGAGKKEISEIAFDFPFTSVPIFASLSKFAKARAEEFGYDVTTSADDADLDRQQSNLRAWIVQKRPVIVSLPIEPTALEPTARDARDAGIVWVTYSQNMKNQDGSILFSGVETGRLVGEAAAEFLKERSGGAGTLAILTLTGLDVGRQRLDGLKAALAQNAPKATIVAEQVAADTNQGLDRTQAILRAHPDLKMVLSVSDSAALGAVRALKNNGVVDDDPDAYVAGMDGSKEALEAIKAGSIFKADAALRIRDIGHAVVDVPRRIILDEARGKTAQVNLPVKLITKSSSELDAYLADFS